ncbi:uncharacterized protein LOC143064177 [Mytilus galloprovincialis]|uniref:uncharacterized protein LOC143064177 n=1 Tax=Mytilus galloprovincialis TaxID=29158 RepID=UPI003F7B6C50
MLEEICIIFITILTCSLAFNLSCPGSGQWNSRAVLYCSDLNKYTCLLDTSKTLYTETCDGSRKETEGYKSTINRNNFDTAKCRPDRFQPIDFTTVGNSDCVFQKFKCAQEGQIAAQEIKKKTSLVDTKCLCDYTKGYSFINLPKDKCYCSPLVDDCSCFREVCPSGKTLSPDYQCTTQIDMKNRKWNCSKIASANDSQNGDQVQQSIKDIDQKNEVRSRIAVQVIVPILVSIMTGLLIWCWKTSKLDKVKKQIIRLVCEKDDDNKTEAINLSTETQHSPEKNDNIQNESLEKDDDNKSEAINVSTETQHSPEKNDKIQDESYEKDDDNKSEAINLSIEIPHSPDKDDEIQNDLSRQRDSKTSVHKISSSQVELKYNQIDGRETDQISQTKQSDSSLSEDDDELSFKSTHSSVTGLNESEDKNRVTNNSTAFEKHHSDKGDDTVDKSSTVEKNDEMSKEYKQLDTTTKDIGDITEESDETNCMVEAEENKIQKNEELSTFAKEQEGKTDDPVEETGTVVAEIEKTSEEDNTDHSDESDANKSDTENEKHSEEDSSDHIDESYANKSDTENKKPSEQDNTDQSDESDAKQSETDNKLKESKLETEDADKIVKTGDPDKIVKTEDPDKIVKTEDPDKIVKTEDPDESIKTETPVATEKCFASLLDDF